MRSWLIALALWSTPVSAETLSQEIARAGIGATKARLAALTTPTNVELFGLAGLRFLGGIELGGIEAALQLRWQTGIRADWSELPILRLPIPENPDARAFVPADFTRLIRDLDADMEAARDALTHLGGRPFALDIAMGDLWFDINSDTLRDPGEDFAAVAGLLGGGRIFSVQVENPVITFDTADAAWLSAYTHFLSAFA